MSLYHHPIISEHGNGRAISLQWHRITVAPFSSVDLILDARNNVKRKSKHLDFGRVHFSLRHLDTNFEQDVEQLTVFVFLFAFFEASE